MMRCTPDIEEGVVQDGVAFTAVAGTNGKVYDHVTCHNCNQMGHFVSHCPQAAG